MTIAPMKNNYYKIFKDIVYTYLFGTLFLQYVEYFVLLAEDNEVHLTLSSYSRDKVYDYKQ